MIRRDDAGAAGARRESAAIITSVPAALVTAGTFPGAAYAFAGALTVLGALVVGADPGGAEQVRVAGVVRAQGGLITGGNSTLNSNVIFNNPTGAARFRVTPNLDAADDLGVYRSAGLWLLAGWLTGLGIRVDTNTGALVVRTDPGGAAILRADGAGRFNAAIPLELFGATNGAGVAAGTLGNAPVAGNPAFWLPVNIGGVTRHIPAW